jgi:hypothetical protein
MRGNPFLNFHHTLEAAGYPALLLVSMFCLGIVVTPVALLGITGAVWVLIIALLSVIGALAILAAELAAAFADHEPLPARRNRRVATSIEESDPVTAARQSETASLEAGEGRRAA